MCVFRNRTRHLSSALDGVRGTDRRRNESHPSEQLEQQTDRWALTVRVTLVEGWSKGEAGKAAGCVCLSVGAV